MALPQPQCSARGVQFPANHDVAALSQRASPRRFKFSSLETREARPAAQEQDRLLLQKTPLVSTQLPSPATGLGVRVTYTVLLLAKHLPGQSHLSVIR